MRRKSPDRLESLAEAALVCFTEGGWKRTQVADVAAAAGVSAGSVYNYVAGKDGLFDLALRHAAGLPVRDAATPAALPLPARSIGEAVRERTADIERRLDWPALRRAAADPEARPVPEVLAEIIAQAFARLSENRRLIALLDRCAPEQPDLRDLHAERLKTPFVDTLARYLAHHAARGRIRPGDATAQARLVLEMTVWMAMDRHRDVARHAIDDDTALREVTAMAIAGLAA